MSVFLEESDSKPPWIRHREWWLEMDVASEVECSYLKHLGLQIFQIADFGMAVYT